MKKFIIILLVINSMGFTTDKKHQHAASKEQGHEKAISQSCGYLEVTSTASYSLTISGN